jgi:glycosyltransferase involved in cell wall biosynthesis
MNFVFVSYNYSQNFSSPEAWIDRIKAYIGSLECLSEQHTVTRVEQINYEGYYIHNGIRYCFTNFPKKKTLFPFRLNRYVICLNPQVVIISGLHYPLQTIQLRLMLGKKVKIIAQNHAERPFKGIKTYLQKLADRCIDAYLFASHELGAEWVKAGNLASAAKIHEVMEVSSVFSPMDKSLAKEKTGVAGTPSFLWVGRLNANKDPLTVVKAFLKFAALTPSARLYMIYHTEELLAQLEQILNSSAQKNAVVLVGRIPHMELQYWFNSADIILSGSHYEGSGTAVCEAMSCGCMPVVSNIASFRMITDKGKCGLLFEPGDELALLTALKQTLRMNIGEKQKIALKYFKSNLSFEAIARGIQKVALSLEK